MRCWLRTCWYRDIQQNQMFSSSQNFRFAFILVFFRLYTTRHDHSDNRDDFLSKLIFLIINIVREKSECGWHNELTYLNHDFAFIDSHAFFALRGLRHAIRSITHEAHETAERCKRWKKLEIFYICFTRAGTRRWFYTWCFTEIET